MVDAEGIVLRTQVFWTVPVPMWPPVAVGTRISRGTEGLPWVWQNRFISLLSVEQQPSDDGLSNDGKPFLRPPGCPSCLVRLPTSQTSDMMQSVR